MVLCSEPIPARFGVPESSVLIFVEREDSEARCWADAALQRLGPELPEHCTLELNPSDHALLETVRKLGFGCAKVDLGGSVSLALSRLRGKTVRPEEHGVELVGVGTGCVDRSTIAGCVLCACN